MEDNVNLSREMMANKRGMNVEFDPTFCKYLIREIQRLSPDIGAVIFKDTKQIVFFYKNIIIYKVLMNALNIEEIKISEHKEKVKTILKMLDLNMIPLKDLQNCRKGIRGINLKLGKIK